MLRAYPGRSRPRLRPAMSFVQVRALSSIQPMARLHSTLTIDNACDERDCISARSWPMESRIEG